MKRDIKSWMRGIKQGEKSEIQRFCGKNKDPAIISRAICIEKIILLR